MNFIVSNVDIFKFLSSDYIDNKNKGIYDGIPGKLKMVDCFICPLVDIREAYLDIDINSNTNEQSNYNLKSQNNETQEEKNSAPKNNKENKNKNKNKNKNTNTKNKKEKYEKDSKNDKKKNKKKEKKKSLSTVQLRIVHSAEQRMLNGNYNPFDSFMDRSQPPTNPPTAIKQHKRNK